MKHELEECEITGKNKEKWKVLCKEEMEWSKQITKEIEKGRMKAKKKKTEVHTHTN